MYKTQNLHISALYAFGIMLLYAFTTLSPKNSWMNWSHSA